MIEETRLPDSVMAELAKLIPGPEPQLEVRIPRIPVAEESLTRRIIPVSDPKLDGNELRYVTQCIQSNWISSAGRFVREFEEAFAAAMGCRYGVAASNGTTSLHLALATLGIGPGDEVIIPTFTMIATANSVRYTGATPVLVDSERGTWNLDVSQLERKVTARTRGICLIHTYGHPVEMDPLLELADRRGLWVVEDAAEAHGALYRGRPIGSLGRAASFSFYANKIITTGEGGMVTTNDAELARVARRLRDHAFSDERHFWHKYLGFNYRMTNLQAAIGLAQTERLEEFVTIRRTNAARYTRQLSKVPGLTLPIERPWARNVYWMYGVVVEDEYGISRDELRRRLARRGIETRTFFIPIHLQPIYYADFRGQRYPVSEELCQRGLYLPSGATLTAAEIDYVCEMVSEARERANP
jgi:perosamine synthetase